MEEEKKEMGQNETKFSLHLPKKEMKLKPDWKAGNKTEGRGSRKKSAGTIRNSQAGVAAKKMMEEIKLHKEKMRLTVCNERLTNWPTLTWKPRRCGAQGNGERRQVRSHPNMQVR